MLLTLTFVLEGRPARPSARAVGNSKARKDEPRRAGRLSQAEQARGRADAVGKMSYEHDDKQPAADAALVGLGLARATGDLETGRQLEALLPTPLPKILARLAELGLLPMAKGAE